MDTSLRYIKVDLATHFPSCSRRRHIISAGNNGLTVISCPLAVEDTLPSCCPPFHRWFTLQPLCTVSWQWMFRVLIREPTTGLFYPKLKLSVFQASEECSFTTLTCALQMRKRLSEVRSWIPRCRIHSLWSALQATVLKILVSFWSVTISRMQVVGFWRWCCCWKSRGDL